MEINLTKVDSLPRVYFDHNCYYIVVKMGTLLKKYTDDDSNQFYFIGATERGSSVVEVIYDQKFILDHSFRDNDVDQAKFDGIYFTDLKLLKYF